MSEGPWVEDEQFVIFKESIYDKVGRISARRSALLRKKSVTDIRSSPGTRPSPSLPGTSMQISPLLWISCQAPRALTKVINLHSGGLTGQNTGPKLAGNSSHPAILKIEGENEIFAREGCPSGGLFSLRIDCPCSSARVSNSSLIASRRQHRRPIDVTDAPLQNQQHPSAMPSKNDQISHLNHWHWGCPMR